MTEDRTWTIEQLRNEVVRRGKEAAARSYNRPEQARKLRGSLAGFDRALHIPLMPEQWEGEIEALEMELRKLRLLQTLPGIKGIPERTEAEKQELQEEYWERRCFQAEIQWTFSVLCVAWKWGRTMSGRAVMTYADIVGVK